MRRGTDVTEEVWRYLLKEWRLDAHFDPVVVAEIEVHHIEDTHINGGVMRAMCEEGSVTKWGEKDPGPDIKAGARALRQALTGNWDGQYNP